MSWDKLLIEYVNSITNLQQNACVLHGYCAWLHNDTEKLVKISVIFSVKTFYAIDFFLLHALGFYNL